MATNSKSNDVSQKELSKSNYNKSIVIALAIKTKAVVILSTDHC